MEGHYIDKIETIKNFLDEMIQFLCSDDFNIDSDLVILTGPDNKTGIKNDKTMIDLEYDFKDAYDRLISLSIEEYSETLIDSYDSLPLHVFCKIINGKQVYIKPKMKYDKNNKKYCFCLSFHFAEYTMSMPYLYQCNQGGEYDE